MGERGITLKKHPGGGRAAGVFATMIVLTNLVGFFFSLAIDALYNRDMEQAQNWCDVFPTPTLNSFSWEGKRH
jgi:hypothetical protein